MATLEFFEQNAEFSTMHEASLMTANINVPTQANYLIDKPPEWQHPLEDVDQELEALLSQAEQELGQQEVSDTSPLGVQEVFEAMTTTPDMQSFERTVESFYAVNTLAINSFFMSDEMRAAAAYMVQNHTNCGENHSTVQSVAPSASPLSSSAATIFNGGSAGSEGGHNHEHWECCDEEVHGTICPKCKKRKGQQN